VPVQVLVRVRAQVQVRAQVRAYPLPALLSRGPTTHLRKPRPTHSAGRSRGGARDAEGLSTALERIGRWKAYSLFWTWVTFLRFRWVVAAQVCYARVVFKAEDRDPRIAGRANDLRPAKGTLDNRNHGPAARCHGCSVRPPGQRCRVLQQESGDLKRPDSSSRQMHVARRDVGRRRVTGRRPDQPGSRTSRTVLTGADAESRLES
jgi:hypothetical protein